MFQAMNYPKRKGKARKLCIQDIDPIVRLIVTRRLTETEACLNLGIDPKQWWVFKQRKKIAPEFASILDRVRGASIQACLDSIDEAGDPQAKVTRSGDVIKVPGDWRAKAWIAERVLSGERFSQQVTPTTSTTTNQILMNCGGEDGLKKLIESYSQGVKAIDPAQPMKRLPNPDTPTGSV